MHLLLIHSGETSKLSTWSFSLLAFFWKSLSSDFSTESETGQVKQEEGTKITTCFLSAVFPGKKTPHSHPIKKRVLSVLSFSVKLKVGGELGYIKELWPKQALFRPAGISCTNTLPLPPLKLPKSINGDWGHGLQPQTSLFSAHPQGPWGWRPPQLFWASSVDKEGWGEEKAGAFHLLSLIAVKAQPFP